MSDRPMAVWRADRAAAQAAGDANASLCWFATQSMRDGPTVRCLVLRDLGDQHGEDLGFAVFLNRSSPKAAALAADNRVEVACWYPTGQVQVRARGYCTPLPAGLLERHWPKRPEPGRRLDHLYADGWAQSSPVDASALAAAHAAVTDAALAQRPAGVSGQRLLLDSLERLQLGDGLHQRQRWQRGADGWSQESLVP